MKKSLVFALLLLAIQLPAVAQTTTYQLSSHILDISAGKPAAEVDLQLSKQDPAGNWVAIAQKRTDANGRVKDFLKQDGTDHRGIYKLTFYTQPYFEASGQTSFYPFIEVVFELKDNEHYHVPITLSAFGYATYRGN